MLYVYGVGEVPISISGNPNEECGSTTFTIRSVGLVTQKLAALESGSMIGVRGPFGVGWPLDKAKGKDLLIVAGGLGLAPLRSVVCSVVEQRAKFGKVSLLYGARTPIDVLFKEELGPWSEHMTVKTTVDVAGRGWKHSVGLVTKLIPRADFDPGNTIALVCGPEVMMKFSSLTLREQGVAAENIFVSMERNMKCGVGHCGHCQIGPQFVCKDGPVYPWNEVEHLFQIREM